MSNPYFSACRDIPEGELRDLMDEVVARDRELERERELEAERCPVCDSPWLDRREGLGETKLKEYVSCRDCKTLLAWG